MLDQIQPAETMALRVLAANHGISVHRLGHVKNAYDGAGVAMGLRLGRRRDLALDQHVISVLDLIDIYC